MAGRALLAVEWDHLPWLAHLSVVGVDGDEVERPPGGRVDHDDLLGLGARSVREEAFHDRDLSDRINRSSQPISADPIARSEEIIRRPVERSTTDPHAVCLLRIRSDLTDPVALNSTLIMISPFRAARISELNSWKFPIPTKSRFFPDTIFYQNRGFVNLSLIRAWRLGSCSLLVI